MESLKSAWLIFNFHPWIFLIFFIHQLSGIRLFKCKSFSCFFLLFFFSEFVLVENESTDRRCFDDIWVIIKFIATKVWLILEFKGNNCRKNNAETTYDFIFITKKKWLHVTSTIMLSIISIFQFNFVSYVEFCSTERDHFNNGATLHVAYPMLSIPFLLMP